MIRKTSVASAATALSVALAQSNIDPANKSAWCENIGWTNWHDAGSPAGAQGVQVHETFLSGFIWAENVGWINVGDGSPANGIEYANTTGADFGVNIDSDGTLRGVAWSENAGWINFDTLAALGSNQQQAEVNLCDNASAGYAWGENLGWVNLDDPTHFVALGPDCAPGDAACDGVIGLSDYSAFKDVLMGPDVPVDCPVFDSDADGDVDLLDLADFQVAFGS